MSEDFTREAAYSDCLTLVAVGETYSDTERILRTGYPSLPLAEVRAIMADGFHDALRQGIERADTDPSWGYSPPAH